MALSLATLYPILVGMGSGIAYGVSFLLQHSGLFGSTPYYSKARQLLFFAIRIIIVVFTGRYLLRSPVIPSILGSIAFFAMFWLVIVTIRAQLYERIRSR